MLMSLRKRQLLVSTDQLTLEESNPRDWIVQVLWKIVCGEWSDTFDVSRGGREIGNSPILHKIKWRRLASWQKVHLIYSQQWKYHDYTIGKSEDFPLSAIIEKLDYKLHVQHNNIHGVCLASKNLPMEVTDQKRSSLFYISPHLATRSILFYEK